MLVEAADDRVSLLYLTIADFPMAWSSEVWTT
jgi:hypothetical protein